MIDQLNRNIKEIIDEYPAVGDVLDAHGIACVTCNVGTCILRDIIEIHNLTPDEEHAVLSGIANVMFPGREVTIPRSHRKAAPERQPYSPPVKKLVDEHVHIKKLLASVPYLVSELRTKPESGRSLVENAVDFIRSYADRYHHAKEEDILFTYCDDTAEIFQVMYRDHEAARAHVAAIVTALDDGDDDAVVTHLEAYATLLTEHIRKEDEALYRWIDRGLSVSQVGELFSRFRDVDAEFGDAPRRHEAFIAELGAR